MQQPVEEPPPPTPITGGEITIPPTSWFNENIVPFLQGESEGEFLQQILDFTKEFQLEQMAAPEEAETFFPTPPTPPMTPDGFTPSADYLSIEFGYLGQLIDILRTGNPDLDDKLQPLIDQLQTIVESPPSTDLLDQMNNILSQLDELAEQIPFPSQVAYMASENGMYQQLTSQLNNEIMDLQAQANALQMQADQQVDPITAMIQLQEELGRELTTQYSNINSTIRNFVEITSLIETEQAGLTPEQAEIIVPIVEKVRQDFTDQLVKLKGDIDLLNNLLMTSTAKTDERSSLISQIMDDLTDFNTTITGLKEIRDRLTTLGSALAPQLDSIINNLTSEINMAQSTLPPIDELVPPTQEEIFQAREDQDALMSQVMQLNSTIMILEGFRDDMQAIASTVAPESDLMNAEETVTASFVTLYQREINTAEEAISILIDGDSTLAPELNQYLAQLNAMNADSLTPEQLQQLNTIQAALNERVEDVDQFHQAQYWDKQVSTVQDMLVSIDDYNTALSTIQDTIDGLPIDDPEREGLQNLVDSISDKTAVLQMIQGQLEQASLFANQKALDTGSLPDVFAHVMFDHYMPMQEDFLEQLANQLYFFNKGAEVGNQLLDDTIEFQGANDNYSFTSFLTKLNDEYSGDVNLVRGELEDEKNQAQRDLLTIENTLSDIDGFIDEVNNDTQLTDDQKSQIIDQLNVDKENLMAARGQLDEDPPNLIDILGSLSVKEGSDSSHFTVSSNKYSDWATLLPQHEGFVINGDTLLAPGSIGGLIPTQQQISADQQQYSDQSQNQQMILQLRMTEIQQEWTIVSTSLQILNQMYITVARGIYR